MSGPSDRRILESLAESCGHEGYRLLAAAARMSLSGTYSAVQRLERTGRISRCGCGRGWVVAPDGLGAVQTVGYDAPNVEGERS